MTAAQRLTVTAVPGLPLVEPGDDLTALIAGAIEAAGERLVDDDVLVVAQKVVSKAEGRYVDLAEVTPSPEAERWAELTGKDARLAEVILRESTEVLRHRPNLLIVEHRLGHVAANAGVDQSNIAHGESERVLLLPADPDGSAARLADALGRHFGARVGVIVSDSVGRAWRTGTVAIALGAAGVKSIDDIRGKPDLFGRDLRVSIVGHADQIAAAAALVIGEAAEGTPVALVRGLPRPDTVLPASDLNRPRSEDLFR